MGTMKYESKIGISKNKFLAKLIVTICMLLILFNFVGTTRVYAEDDESWGGILIKPIVKMLTGIGDAIIEVLQKNINGDSNAFIKIEGKVDWWTKWGAKALGVLIGIAVVAGTIALAIVTGGTSLAVTAIGIGAVIKISAVGIIAGATGGYLIADNLDGTDFPEDIYLPMFTIGIDQIFSNEVALLDVNFFSNDTNRYVKTKVEVIEKEDEPFFTWGPEVTTGGSVYANIIIESEDSKTPYAVYIAQTENPTTGNSKAKNLLELCFTKINEQGENINWQTDEDDKYMLESVNGGILVTNKNNNRSYTIIYTQTSELNNATNGIYKYTETLQIKKIEKETITTEEPIISTAMQLREIISTWYFILRNIALLVLMLVLIYIGIRIVIGSTAGEKAKYKERLMDWLVALCLLFVMHYIMVFAVELVEKITDFVAEIASNGRVEMIELTEDQELNLEQNYPEIYKEYVSEGTKADNSSAKRLMWQTDLMGAIKIKSQQEKMGTAEWCGLALTYMVLVLYTLFFIWTYLKRVVYLAFLTMIAPLVAMTYPIDKINDGKAQAFNMWFREYIFNLLIQPMHLLLYSILITSAYGLAAENVMYTLVAIGFMMPAEKLVRKFFGFEKAQTPGLLSGAAGAALAMTGLQKLTSRHPRGGKGGSGGHESKENDSKSPRMAKKDGVDTFGTLTGRGGEKIIGKEDKLSTEIEKAGQSLENSKDALLGINGNEGEGTNKLRVTTSTDSNTPAVLPGSDEKGTNGNATKGNSRMSRIRRTISGVTQNYARQLGNKALKRVKNGHPIRTMLRGAAGLTGGALLGLTGAALGIASGDPSKVLQYTSAGVLAGYGAGGGLADSLTDTFSVNTKELEDETELSWYGDEYAEHKYNQQLERDLKSGQNISRIRALTGWSRDKTMKFLNTTGVECYNSGVNDVEDMLAIKAAMEEGDADKRVPTMQEAIAAVKLNNSLSQSIGKMTGDKVEKYEKTYAEKFKSNLRKLHPDWDETKINNQAASDAQTAIRYMKSLDSAKSGLTKV